jgi:hypothetical protein
MNLRLQPVRVRTGSSDTEGLRVFTGEYLVAVLVQLSEEHGEQTGFWFLEAGFDGAEDLTRPTFKSLEEAQAWIEQRIV